MTELRGIGPLYSARNGVWVGSGAWERPSDWLTLSMPTDESIVGLVAILPPAGSLNILHFAVAGDYNVDWGDGTSENVASGVHAYHSYVFNDISSGTLCSRGYRQVVVTITPQAGSHLLSATFAGVGFGATGSAGLVMNSLNNWLDVACHTPNLTSLVFGEV